MAALRSPTYKVTFLDGAVEEYPSSMHVHIAVERKWPVGTSYDGEGRAVMLPRPDVEMVNYAAWLSSGSGGSFDEWCKRVGSVEEVVPKADPSPPAAGVD